MKLIFFLLLAFAAPLHGTQMHLFMVGDTSSNIGKTIGPDLEKMQSRMEQISCLLEIPLKTKIVSDYTMSSQLFFETLDAWEIESDDIFIFYFSGHGFRGRSKDILTNPWPNLIFSQEQKSVDFLEVVDLLKEKNPRFLLAITDSCNNYLPEFLFPVIKHKNRRWLSLEPMQKSAAHSLFQIFTGEILISASSPSEVAFCVEKGALFTHAFDIALNDALNGNIAANWNTILYHASIAVEFKQTPFFFLNLE